MAEVNKKQLTPFEKEQIETAKIIVEYKQNCEANIVSIIYKHPDEIFNTNLTTDLFSNNVWRVYFEIAYDILINEGKKVLDDIKIDKLSELTSSAIDSIKYKSTDIKTDVTGLNVSVTNVTKDNNKTEFSKINTSAGTYKITYSVTFTYKSKSISTAFFTNSFASLSSSYSSS